MSSGPCVVLALEAPDAIKKWRALMGATDPAKADAGTLRKDFGESIEFNATHGSDAPETAAFELGYFFGGLELALGERLDRWAERSSSLDCSLVGLGLLISAGVPLGRLPGDITIRRGNSVLPADRHLPGDQPGAVVILSVFRRWRAVICRCSDAEGSPHEPSNPTAGSSAWRSSTA